ncbi:MAG: MFS transporter [Gammaproteobacteria bacterium]|nr:MFS transporter [Gammaproteobacteria bacterium]
MCSLPTKNKTSVLSLLPLFMVILLDIAGIILVLPVLTPLILQPDSLIIPAGTSLWMRDFLYGFSLALFPLFMFFSTPVLGDLSDKFGRKKILLICLIGSAISYCVAAFGVIVHSLWILLLSRIIAGLAAGTQSIATAAIIDASTPQTKTKYLSWTVFTSSLGLIIGPLIGGLTAEKNLVSWFSFQTPFILAALVCFLNAILLCYFFKEKVVVKTDKSVPLLKGFRLFIASFLDKRFRLLSLVYFCFILAWSLYYQSINWLFLVKYHYSVFKIGLFVGFIGVIFTITTALIARTVLGLFSKETHLFAFFIFTMAIANMGAAISHSEIAQWLWVILNAASDVICFTVALSIFSNLANHESQGWIMGVTGSIGAITWTIGGLIAGPLGYIAISVPLWTAGILCLISFWLMLIYQKSGEIAY